MTPALVFACLSVAPGDTTVSFSFRHWYLTGETYYEIRGRNASGTWRSRLSFPVNTFFDGGAIGVDFGSVPLSLSLWGWGSTKQKAGTFTDDDYTNGVRDVWSRSGAELDACGAGGQATLFVFGERTFRAGPLFGVSYENFRYRAYDVRQFALNPDDQATVAGKVLTYRQERLSFPLGIAVRYRPLSFLELGWEGGVSLFTYIWDRDDHILREKLSETEALAVEVPSRLSLRYLCGEHFHVELWGEVLYFESYWGRQDQEFYAGPRLGEAYEGIKTNLFRLTYGGGIAVAVSF